MTESEKQVRDDDELDDEYLDLVHQVMDAGWNPGDVFYSTEGVTRQFREAPYTSNFPGMVERSASGKTNKDAFRNFLKELQAEKDAQQG